MRFPFSDLVTEYSVPSDPEILGHLAKGSVKEKVEPLFNSDATSSFPSCMVSIISLANARPSPVPLAVFAELETLLLCIKHRKVYK